MRLERPPRALLPRLLLLSTLLVSAGAAGLAGEAPAGDAGRLQPADVFDLEWASDPRISPDGERIAYVRNFMDVHSDRRRSNIWLIGFDGEDHRPITSGNNNNSSPRWSPAGDRLLWVSTEEGSAQLHMHWLESGATARITNLTRSPGGLAWSPDGRWIALTMRVPKRGEPLATMPPKPEGAEWAEPPRVIESITYRADGAGFLEEGYTHLFVVPAEGGTPRRLTEGDFDHGGTPAWTPDGRHLLFSTNHEPDWEYDPLESEIWEIAVDDGATRVLTDRDGPDHSPAVSPDGERIAYLGFDDRKQGYQVTRLHVMNRDGSGSRVLAVDLDRTVQSPVWAADGSGLFVQYATEGEGRLARVSLDGEVRTLAGELGNSIGRPYAGGSFSVASGSPSGRYVYTLSTGEHPADLAVGELGGELGSAGGETRRITELNRDLLAHKELAGIEEIRYESSFDGRPIQGWIARPPGFDPDERYPMILEIHGGPFANYGDRWSTEVQLYAAAGYVVLYVNPRGSSSYGEEFGNLIHHDYPNHDYDDLMSGVDALLERGYVDPERLYVTGGSGGGVLTAWIVGHTDRFRAAVSAKPVINWYSFALTADFYTFFHQYWFPAPPWEAPEEYLRRSPLSYVGNVTTPTMLLTGEVDYRTPMSESEQFYQALKLRKVDTALVRIPGASHGIADRPSQLVAKVAHVLAWFERYGGHGAGPQHQGQ